MSLVKGYKPIDKDTISGKYYKIELTYLDGSKEEIHFIKEKDERDEYLKFLDKNSLLTDL